MAIQRKQLVQRHNPMIRSLEPLSPLSIGNGEFAFTADVTGLQSFPEHYEVPLSTQSQWGWHSSGGRNKYGLKDLQMTELETYGRQVPYPIQHRGQEEVFNWLRYNPHRLHLAQVGFVFLKDQGERVKLEEIEIIEQTLDLWSGVLYSRFRIEGEFVQVTSCCHPDLAYIAVRVESTLTSRKRLQVEIKFPSPEVTTDDGTKGIIDWSKEIAWKWTGDEGHRTDYQQQANGATFQRLMDDDSYHMQVAFSSGQVQQVTEHHYVIDPHVAHHIFEFGFRFYADEASLIQELPSFESTVQFSTKHWEQFWLGGGVIELSESRDPRAVELERRVVLSQYLTAIHCAGSLPPQETGLLYNSWFGKFHLEMHWWHGVHFPLWNREHLLRKSLSWYREILPVARQLAQAQGYRGARWPKMVGPDGIQSPSGIGAVLIWQQPHPIMLAELCYQANPQQEILNMFSDIVMESAEFMCSYAVWDSDNSRYVLGPPLIPAQERHKSAQTFNPTYELEYWHYALGVALQWCKRLGLPEVQEWVHVRDHLSQLPVVDGVYQAHENCPDTFERVNIDHPSMLGALGMLPGHMVEQQTMRNTLQRVMQEWKWDTAWGWDFPMAAMTAARLGEGRWAVDLLLKEATKNTYLPNGHNYQRPGLLAYLPGNGGLLAAVAMMACGWAGYNGPPAPGFPDDGSWTVRFEGLRPIL